MRVLFVCSGFNRLGIPLRQAESLRKKNINVEVFTISNKGLKGYLLNFFKLKKYLSDRDFDIIHAHYSLSGFIAALLCKGPLIVSLMGSDVYSGLIVRTFIKLFHRFRWRVCIVKSQRMKDLLNIKNACVIPNGVNIEDFKPIDRTIACKHIGWNPCDINILFPADPSRMEKNYSLAEKSIGLLQSLPNIKLWHLKDVPYLEMIYYYNAANVILLTSFWEGSPNVIKEAMACSRPIVSTDVGDVRELIAGTTGCLISEFSPHDVAQKIIVAINFSEGTKGREKISDLSSEKIADRLISLYKLYLPRNV
jgi:teichuronic acid biosynthesis glycosyltransferase TuaC